MLIPIALLMSCVSPSLDSRPASQAKHSNPEAAWAEACRSDNAEAYRDFLKVHGTSSHREEAVDRLLWKRAEGKETIPAIRTYLNAPQEKAYISEADNLLWQIVTREHTASNLHDYLTFAESGLIHGLHLSNAQNEIGLMLNDKELTSKQHADLKKRVENFYEPFGLSKIYKELSCPIPPSDKAISKQIKMNGDICRSAEMIVYHPDYPLDNVSAHRTFLQYEKISEKPSMYAVLGIVDNDIIKITHCEKIDMLKCINTIETLCLNRLDANGTNDMICSQVLFLDENGELKEEYLKLDGKWHQTR